MSMICEHGRLRFGCEDCAFLAGLDQGTVNPAGEVARTAEPGRAPRLVTADAAEVAEADGRILRPDLDALLDTTGSYTVVRAGEPIPPALAAYKRVSVTSAELAGDAKLTGKPAAAGK